MSWALLFFKLTSLNPFAPLFFIVDFMNEQPKKFKIYGNIERGKTDYLIVSPPALEDLRKKNYIDPSLKQIGITTKSTAEIYQEITDVPLILANPKNPITKNVSIISKEKITNWLDSADKNIAKYAKGDLNEMNEQLKEMEQEVIRFSHEVLHWEPGQ
jgi:hypothetical protein